MCLNIISGKWKNTYITTPSLKYLKFTSTIIKKKLFSWIDKKLYNFDCLDLFAGCGSLGFEAASRLCRHVTLVEKNILLYKFLINLKKKLFATNIDILNLKAYLYFKKFSFKKYDILFLDPPYGGSKFLISLLKLSLCILKPCGLIFLESLFNIFTIINYFKLKLKIIKNDNYNKINFFLLQLI